MRPRARRAAVCGVVAFILLAPTAAAAGPRVPASAVRASSGQTARFRPGSRSFHITRNDGNDAKGPLDLKELTITHGWNQDVISFKTQTKVSNAQLDPSNGNFAIGIDTKDNGKFQFFEYVFHTTGGLETALYDVSTRSTMAYLPAKRLSGSSFRTAVAFGRIFGGGATYRFVLFSYYQGSPCSKKRPCLDAIPNRSPMLAMDHARPTAKIVPPSGYSGGIYAADGSAQGTFSFQGLFTDDRHGVGIGTWELTGQMLDHSWKLVRSGTGVGTKFVKTVSVTAPAPGEYQYRFRTADRQGNRSRWSQNLWVSVPFDETDPSVSTTGTWTPISSPDAFGGSVVGSSTAGDTITFAPTITGYHLCVMLGPTTADGTTVTVSMDGTPQTLSIVENTTTLARSTVCYSFPPFPSQTLGLTVGTNSAPFVVDGFYVTQW